MVLKCPCNFALLKWTLENKPATLLYFSIVAFSVVDINREKKRVRMHIFD